MAGNIVADIRSARLANTVKAYVATHDDLPSETRRRLANHAGAVGSLVKADQTDLSVTVVDSIFAAFVVLRTERPKDAEWCDTIGRLCDEYKKGVRREHD